MTSKEDAPESALVAYALALDWNDIAPDDRERMAALVADTIAVSIGAHEARQPSALITEDYMLARAGDAARSGESALWSGRGRLPADEAALVNGTAAEVLDFQDTVVDPRNNGHAGVTIVPALLAVAEAEHKGGRELLTAIAAALEVTIAILRAVGRRHRTDGRGFRTTSIAAPLGAAVGCARLMGLSLDQALNAMGITAACANNGLMPSLDPGTGAFGMDKDYVNGLSAQLAVNSARLAARGLTGSPMAVTGAKGVVASHAHGDPAPLVTPKAGAPNLRCVALKYYAACYGVHSAVDATLDLMKEHGIEAGAIERILVRVKADSSVTLSGRTLANHMAARFSLPYAVASAAMRRSCRPEHYEPPMIFDRDVQAFMDKVELAADPELTRWHDETGGFPAIVEITAGGRTVESRVDHPLGSAQRPMTRAMLEAKFDGLTRNCWNDATRAAIHRDLASLPELDDIATLMRKIATRD